MIDQYNSLSEKFLRKWFWLYIFSFVLAPIWYVIKIIVSNELSVNEVWILYGVISLVTLIWAFNDFWMTESLNFFLPKFITKKRYDKAKTVLVYAILVQTITWIFVTSLLFFGSSFIANNYFQSSEASNILKIFSLFFIWINVFQILQTFFISIQNTFLHKISELFRMWFTLMCIVLVYFNNLSSLISYSFSWIIGLYIWILIAIFFFYTQYYKIYFKEVRIIWSQKLFKQVASYALWVVIWAQAASILGQMDMQMIIYLLGTKQAGYYTNYLSIIGIPFMIIWPIFWLLFPIFSEMYSKNEFDKIKLIKQIFQKNFLALAIAFNILFFVLAPSIAYTLFWEKFIVSWNILQYSILFLAFNFLLQINFNILAWIGQIKDRVKIIIIALFFNFFTNILLISLMGIYWAALATWMGWVLIWILSEVFLWKKYFTSLDYSFLIKNILIMWALWFILYSFINPVLLWFWRWKSLLFISIIGFLWFWSFMILNLREFKKFIFEIKRLKR